jgi:hypothetical protein
MGNNPQIKIYTPKIDFCQSPQDCELYEMEKIRT